MCVLESMGCSEFGSVQCAGGCKDGECEDRAAAEFQAGTHGPVPVKGDVRLSKLFFAGRCLVVPPCGAQPEDAELRGSQPALQHTTSRWLCLSGCCPEG